MTAVSDARALSIRQAAFTVDAVLVDRKAMTIAVYDQIPTEGWYWEVQFDEHTRRTPLWSVNRCPASCAGDEKEQREEMAAERRAGHRINPHHYDVGPHVHVLAVLPDGGPINVRVSRSRQTALMDWTDDELRDEGGREALAEWKRWRETGQAYVGVGR